MSLIVTNCSAWLPVSFARSVVIAAALNLLCAEAETITLNSWRQRCKSFVVAVRFSSLNQKYPKTLPMTVDILNTVIINDDEEKLYKEKEQKIIYEKIINKYKR